MFPLLIVARLIASCGCCESFIGSLVDSEGQEASCPEGELADDLPCLLQLAMDLSPSGIRTASLPIASPGGDWLDSVPLDAGGKPLGTSMPPEADGKPLQRPSPMEARLLRTLRETSRMLQGLHEVPVGTAGSALAKESEDELLWEQGRPPAAASMLLQRSSSMEAAELSNVSLGRSRPQPSAPPSAWRLAAGMAVNGSLLETAAGRSLSSAAAAAAVELGTLAQGGVLPSGVLGWILFIIGLVVIIFVSCWACTRCTGKALEMAIESYDVTLLGVDVDIGRLLVNPFRGKITIDGLKVHNPAGYASEYLLKAKLLSVDFNVLSLMASCFSHVDLEAVVVKNVDVIYEKSWSGSNVSDVLEFLGGEEDEKRRKRRKKTKRKEDADKMSVHAMKVVVEDVGMLLQGPMFCGCGPRLALADIRSEAFTKEVGGTYMDDVLNLLLRSVLKSVVANVVGKTAAEKCY